MPYSEYETVLQTLEVDATTLVTDDKGTLNLGHAQLEDAETNQSLPRIVLAGPDAKPTTSVDLELKSTIGSGGTATVWAAAQPALRRTVAVKQLRPDKITPETRAQLLQEARITGALEHPNIVPVHGLGVTDDDSPLLIMKYIEGTPWRTTLEPLYASEGEVPAPEVVERQLRTLLSVTTAIHFGHGRGVLHRDIKPENVMLGPDDEVYLVDWGLAVALRAEVDLPLADEVSMIAGTPGYMAPEMAASRGNEFSVRTDVYQLGAVLHELVTGRRRNAGTSVIEQLAAAYKAPPFEYGDWVPAELAELCNRACHKDPAQRFEDAAAFREAVEAFLQHRTSRELAAEARARVRRLETMARSSTDDPAKTADPAAWNRWSTEARFGYRHALREWSGNDAAREGLQSLLELLIQRELKRDNPRAATELASELPTPNEALREQIRAAERRVAARKADAEAMARHRRENDPNVSAGIRRQISYINGASLLLAAGFLFALRVLGIREPSYPDLLGATVFVGVVMYVGELRVLQQGRNEINRRLMSGILRVIAAVGGLFALCWWAGVDIVHAEALAMFAAGVGGMMLAHGLDRGLVWSGVAFYGTSIGVFAFPELRGLVIAIGGFAGFSLGAWAWRRMGERAPPGAEPEEV